MLDKSQGPIGPELVTNGTFDTDTSGWVVASPATFTWSAGGGVIARNGAALSAFPTQTILTAGKKYRISFDVVAVSNLVRLYTSLVTFTAENSSPDISAVGSYSYILTAGSSSITIGAVGATNATCTIDNVSVKELPGNHATQSVTAARPILARVPASGRRNILVGTATLATQTRVVTAAQHTLSFRGTGTVTLTGASISGPLVGTGADDIVLLTFTPTAGNLTLTVLGTVNDAQLELGAVRTAYQLVGATTYDVTEAGQADNYFLWFDGIDDSMITPTITPGIDKVQVFAGVRKLSDAAPGALIEASASITANNGVFLLTAPSGVVGSTQAYHFSSKGTVASPAAAPDGQFGAPITNVLTGLGDISGDRSTLRIDGTQVAQSTADQGTGNFLAYPLYIGSRAGTSVRFNGHLYSMLVRFGANLDANVITQTETYVASKTAGVELT
jgi:hypothetical protein